MNIGTPVHHPPIRGISISLCGIVRPTVIPSVSGCVHGVGSVTFVGRPVIVSFSKKGAPTCIGATLPNSRLLWDFRAAKCRPGTCPAHDVRLLPVRTSDVDVDIADKRVFHVDFHVIDVIDTFHYRVITVVGESQGGAIGASVWFARHAVGQKGGVGNRQRGLYMKHLYLATAMVAAGNQIVVPGAQLWNLDGIDKIGYGRNLMGGRSGTPEAVCNGHPVRGYLLNRNGLGSCSCTPKIGYRTVGRKGDGVRSTKIVIARDGRKRFWTHIYPHYGQVPILFQPGQKVQP